jgi:hypothetical protein
LLANPVRLKTGFSPPSRISRRKSHKRPVPHLCDLLLSQRWESTKLAVGSVWFCSARTSTAEATETFSERMGHGSL